MASFPPVSLMSCITWAKVHLSIFGFIFLFLCDSESLGLGSFFFLPLTLNTGKEVCFLSNFLNAKHLQVLLAMSHWVPTEARWNMVQISVWERMKEGILLCVAAFTLSGRWIYSFAWVRVTGVKLPFITPMKHGWVCNMCDQREDFACMMVASRWSLLRETSSKGPSSPWDGRSDCQPLWQLDDHMKSPRRGGGNIYVCIKMCVKVLKSVESLWHCSTRL